MGCGLDEVCLGGLCVCAPGAVECEGVCIDATDDPLNCGGCAVACDDATVCVDSECICPDRLAICDGACIDTQIDALNCGDCGAECDADLVCAAGECVCPGEGGRRCFDECVDVATDVDNCGECGVRCRVTETCIGGGCACPADWGRCDDGLCAAVLTDPLNCGECGVTCGDSAVCGGGECLCEEGLDRCEDGCVELDSDPANCGECGNVCEPGDVCTDGECHCPGATSRCEDGCFDLESDEENCGECGVTCAADEFCDRGECGCPCGGATCAEDTCFVLPPDSGIASTGFTFVSDPRQADIAINLDTTGSMGGELGTLRAALRDTIVPAARGAFANTGFALSTFDDFPCDGHGSGSDRPFILRQRVTTEEADVQASIESVGLHSGADYFESGYESLFQVATGAGVVGCGATNPSFNPLVDYEEGVADGEIGGVGFRDRSLPIVVHITDAPSHDGTAYGAFAATSAETVAALGAIQARFVGVASGSDARGQLESLAESTGSRVPACGWGTVDERPATCAAGQCCTRADGAGRPADGEGLCPLVFDVSSSGVGLDTSIVSAIQVLARFSPYDVHLRVTGDPDWLDLGVDTACLVASTEVRDVTSPPDGCGVEPEIADFDDDGVDDGVADVTAGISMEFGLNFENDCIVATGVCPVHFDVIAGEAASFATGTIYVYVP